MNYINLGPVRIGHVDEYQKELTQEPRYFFDNQDLVRADAVERVWYLPEKQRKPVIVADKEYQKTSRYRSIGGFSGKAVVKHDGKYWMFYSVYHLEKKNDRDHEYRSFAYSTSKDGFTWESPENNRITHNGPEIIQNPKTDYWELQCVTRDEKHDQWIAMGHCRVKQKGYTFYAKSDNPLKWDAKSFIRPYSNTDIHALLGWDTRYNRYISYPRICVHAYGKTIRAIGYSESKDFKRWTEPKLVVHPEIVYGDGRTEIYNMPVDRVGNYYISYPIAYVYQKDGFGPLDTDLMYSRNGKDFIRPFNQHYISRGRAGEWDDTYAMTSPPIEIGNNLHFYYWGCDFPHDEGFDAVKQANGSIGVAILPKGKYCSLSSPRGTETRVDLGVYKVACTSKIRLNTDVSRGRLFLILNRNGKETKEEHGNTKEMHYTSKFTVNKGEEVGVSVILRDAELFSIQLA